VDQSKGESLEPSTSQKERNPTDRARDVLALQEKINLATDSHAAVMIAAEYSLDELGATNDQSKKSASDIVAHVFDELKITLPVSRDTFYPYLSNVVTSASSKIVSAGRGRGGGYYLSEQAEQVVLATASQETSSPPVHGNLEEQLYPIFHRWLVGQGYNSRVTGSMRSLGKWSNPDISGIRVSEHFGRFDIEISTIEAKRNLENWEQFFFQAVSHRRYANRAYFAFPVLESTKDKLPEDMRYYSELYNVGVLTLILSEEDYRFYRSGQPLTPADAYVGDVVEVLAARSGHVPMSYQRRFCEALEIRDIQGLLGWGER